MNQWNLFKHFLGIILVLVCLVYLIPSVNFACGSSMEPMLYSGDIIILKEPNREIEEGDIIAFRVDGTRCIHEVLANVSGEYYTIGINNMYSDQYHDMKPVVDSEIIGEYQTKIGIGETIHEIIG